MLTGLPLTVLPPALTSPRHILLFSLRAIGRLLTVECIPLATIGGRFMKLPDAALDKVRKIVVPGRGAGDVVAGAGPG